MKATFLSSLAFVLTVAGPLPAQTASFQLFGTSCSPPEGTPTMSNSGLPVLGQSMTLIYSGPNAFGGGIYSYRPHLVIGFNLIFPGVTIPQGLFSMQPPNCDLFVTHDIVLPMPQSAAPEVYENTLRVSVPNNPALAGNAFFAQWLTVYDQCGIVPPCSVPWIATSEAGVALMGF